MGCFPQKGAGYRRGATGGEDMLSGTAGKLHASERTPCHVQDLTPISAVALPRGVPRCLIATPGCCNLFFREIVSEARGCVRQGRWFGNGREIDHGDAVAVRARNGEQDVVPAVGD